MSVLTAMLGLSALKDRKLDDLSLSLACSNCGDTQEPFTIEGVLWDWCNACQSDTLVPIRRAALPVSEVWRG